MFKFNWFASRIHLDHGFDIPHLIITDGSLTDLDVEGLRALPGLTVDTTPITLYNIPNPILTGKLELFSRGLCLADRVIVVDADIFFYRPWDSVIRKILTSGAICLRDWSSSIGWNLKQYKDLFGVVEDLTSPCCNTGIYSIPRDLYWKIPPILEKHKNTPFQLMEDQGIFFAAFYGQLEYITEIQCIVNGLENIEPVWQQILENTFGAHLQGMRTRPRGVSSLIDYSLKHFPEMVRLSQFTPVSKDIFRGQFIHGSYCYTSLLEAYPSKYQGQYIVDGMYFHAGSTVEWQLPIECHHLDTQFICMDTGKLQDCKPVKVNGQSFNIGDKISVDLQGRLKIETEYSEGGHICFLKPLLRIKVDVPSQIDSATYGAGNSKKDVTALLKLLSIYGRIDIKVGNEMFGEPAYGLSKELIVIYKDGREIRIPENTSFILES